MSRPFTVYFDTNFYVWLGHTDSDAADKAISELNAMEIRHVMSGIILRELLAGAYRPSFDDALVSRVRGLTIPPYVSDGNPMWESLLINGKARELLAHTIHAFHDGATEANSFAVLAKNDLSDEKNDEVTRVAKAQLREHGFPEELQANLPDTILAIKKMLEPMERLLGISIDFPSELTSDSAQAFLEQIREKLNPALFDQTEMQLLIKKFVTKTETRPFDVITGKANEKTARNLGTNYRDSERIGLFISQAGEIDLLQVDRANWNLIKESRAPHPLVERGLDARCFTCKPSDVIGKVRAMKETMESAGAR